MKTAATCLALVLLLVADLASARADAASRPRRVVSINLCSDVLALELADSGTVKSVFRVSADPEDSPVADLAKKIPLNNATAEEILAAKPDLVLAHRYSSSFTLALLARAHVPVVQVKDADSFEDIRDNVRAVAAALGHPEKGEAWIARFDASLAASKRAAPAHPLRAVIYQDLGGAAAANTILGALLEHAGFENVVKASSSGGFVNLSIEDLIEKRPDFVAVGIYRAKEPSLAHALLAHPALAEYVRRHARAVDLPAKLWTCGTPFITEIADRLAAARDGFDTPGKQARVN
ncbi:ABC transporter substrate-binding protein [Parvibaculum sp.]|uniref:ABC transporter substrate-binding protein n=1 Tax=Parvibaculum sp. TaxID=2024848 RepID=UPI002B955A77|nr:ABC transporter substrate-binding protein [Parvibaculum sp.]HUD50665.1 ABC transporter substrate-binding protein [Parvibaculum sp.]